MAMSDEEFQNLMEEIGRERVSWRHEKSGREKKRTEPPYEEVRSGVSRYVEEMMGQDAKPEPQPQPRPVAQPQPAASLRPLPRDLEQYRDRNDHASGRDVILPG